MSHPIACRQTRNILTPYVKWSYTTAPGEELAIVMPGLRYHCDRPLLAQARQFLLDRGCALLQCHFDYVDDSDFMTAPDEWQFRQIARDGTSIANLAMGLRAFSRVWMVGKSLGSLTMHSVLQSWRGPEVRSIWLTPGLARPGLSKAIRAQGRNALVLLGDRDPYHTPEHMTPLQQARGVSLSVIAGADHAFAGTPEHPEAELVGQALQAIGQWVGDLPLPQAI